MPVAASVAELVRQTRFGTGGELLHPLRFDEVHRDVDNDLTELMAKIHNVGQVAFKVHSVYFNGVATVLVQLDQGPLRHIFRLEFKDFVYGDRDMGSYFNITFLADFEPAGQTYDIWNGVREKSRIDSAV